MINRSWNTVHKVEKKERYFFLRRLSLQEGFRIFVSLYQISNLCRSRNNIDTLSSDKIRALSRTHSIFKKLKR